MPSGRLIPTPLHMTQRAEHLFQADRLQLVDRLLARQLRQLELVTFLQVGPLLMAVQRSFHSHIHQQPLQRLLCMPSGMKLLTQLLTTRTAQQEILSAQPIHIYTPVAG